MRLIKIVLILSLFLVPILGNAQLEKNLDNEDSSNYLSLNEPNKSIFDKKTKIEINENKLINNTNKSSNLSKDKKILDEDIQNSPRSINIEDTSSRLLEENYYSILESNIVAKVNNDVEYLHRDRLGSNIATTGNDLKRNKNLPFGQEISNDGITYSFTGKELDDNDLYYFVNRYYNPDSGRFLETDSVLNNHPYVYANNNPLLYVDPDGRDAVINRPWQIDFINNLKNRLPFGLGKVTPSGEDIVLDPFNFNVGMAVLKPSYLIKRFGSMEKAFFRSTPIEGSTSSRTLAMSVIKRIPEEKFESIVVDGWKSSLDEIAEGLNAASRVGRGSKVGGTSYETGNLYLVKEFIPGKMLKESKVSVAEAESFMYDMGVLLRKEKIYLNIGNAGENIIVTNKGKMKIVNVDEVAPYDLNENILQTRASVYGTYILGIVDHVKGASSNAAKRLEIGGPDGALYQSFLKGFSGY